MTEEVTQEEESKFHRVTTLGELGPNLPIIRRDSEGKPISDRSFSFLSWDMEAEEKISDMRAKARNVGDAVNKMMCMLIDQFCGQDFQAKKPEDKTLLVNQLEFPNVMYMYIWLRVEELGPELKLNLTCPNISCRKTINDYMADLNTLNVHVKDADHDRLMHYELRKPINLESGQLITGFELDISKWEYMESADKNIAQNQARMKQTMLRSSINGFMEGDSKVESYLDPLQVIKKMKKVDIEKSIWDLTTNNSGPDMRIGGKCPHCDNEFVKVLDWSFDSFFDSSSL